MNPFGVEIVPAGLDRTEVLTNGKRWDESIYMEVLNKCNSTGAPPLLVAKEPDPWTTMLALKVVGFPIATICFGIVGLVIGGTAGALIGSAAGGLFGALNIKNIGPGPGAEAGFRSGAAVGSVYGVFVVVKWSIRAAREITSHQAELEKIQEAIERINEQENY